LGLGVNLNRILNVILNVILNAVVFVAFTLNGRASRTAWEPHV
jgi:hypothetical protein